MVLICPLYILKGYHTICFLYKLLCQLQYLTRFTAIKDILSTWITVANLEWTLNTLNHYSYSFIIQTPLFLITYQIVLQILFIHDPTFILTFMLHIHWKSVAQEMNTLARRPLVKYFRQRYYLTDIYVMIFKWCGCEKRMYRLIYSFDVKYSVKILMPISA